MVASREGSGNHRMVVSWAQLTGTNPFARQVIPPANLLLPGAPMVGDGSFTYDPNGQFEHLNSGESAMTTFTYTAQFSGDLVTFHDSTAIPQCLEKSSSRVHPQSF